jgi:hypothetical protein
MSNTPIQKNLDQEEKRQVQNTRGIFLGISTPVLTAEELRRKRTFARRYKEMLNRVKQGNIAAELDGDFLPDSNPNHANMLEKARQERARKMRNHRSALRVKQLRKQAINELGENIDTPIMSVVKNRNSKKPGKCLGYNCPKELTEMDDHALCDDCWDDTFPARQALRPTPNFDHRRAYSPRQRGNFQSPLPKMTKQFSGKPKKVIALSPKGISKPVETFPILVIEAEIEHAQSGERSCFTHTAKLSADEPFWYNQLKLKQLGDRVSSEILLLNIVTRSEFVITPSAGVYAIRSLKIKEGPENPFDYKSVPSCHWSSRTIRMDFRPNSLKREYKDKLYEFDGATWHSYFSYSWLEQQLVAKNARIRELLLEKEDQKREVRDLQECLHLEQNYICDLLEMIHKTPSPRPPPPGFESGEFIVEVHEINKSTKVPVDTITFAQIATTLDEARQLAEKHFYDEPVDPFGITNVSPFYLTYYYNIYHENMGSLAVGSFIRGKFQWITDQHKMKARIAALMKPYTRTQLVNEGDLQLQQQLVDTWS